MQLAGGLALGRCSQGSADPGAPVWPQVGLRPNVSHHLLLAQLIKSQTPSQGRGEPGDLKPLSPPGRGGARLGSCLCL